MSGLLETAFNIFPGVFIQEVDIAAFHAAGEEDAVGIFYHLEERLTGAADGSILSIFRMADPLLAGNIIDHVFTNNDTGIVEFKSLGGVDASNLGEAVRI